MTRPPSRFFQVCNGQGAGNIGDELMNRAFWDALPDGVELESEVFPNAALQREPYPQRHSYRTIDWQGHPRPAAMLPALLVGDTPVTETLGGEWPLGFLTPRLEAFHAAGLPVDALGVGVEPLRSDAARELFRRAFLPIRSWSVRSAHCRERLMDLGVDPKRIVVGADWAWLYRTRVDRSAWARALLAAAGWRAGPPLLLVNVVNEIWQDRADAKRALARACDQLIREHGLQVAFFCNEMRAGAFFDHAAATEVRALMQETSLLIPPEYFTPDEALALIAQANVTLSSRYHFTVQSVLAGRVPVTLARSAKMTDLLEELGHKPVGTLAEVTPDAVTGSVVRALEDGPRQRARLDSARASLKARAAGNFALWPIASVAGAAR